MSTSDGEVEGSEADRIAETVEADEPAARAFRAASDVKKKALLALVAKNVRDHTPFSVVRFGEGEGRLLLADRADRKSVSVARNKIRRQTGLLLKENDVLAIRDRIVLAFDEADVIGIRGSDSFNDEHLMWVGLIENYLAENPREGRAPALVSHSLLNNWLWEGLPDILRDQEKVSVISCRNLQPLLNEQFGVPDVVMYKTPSQFVMRQVDDDYEAEMHATPIWPDVVTDIENRISVRHPGEIFLVGAGLFGKHLCIAIRQKGGIALDMGSRLDFMVGKVTRGAGKPVVAAISTTQG